MKNMMRKYVKLSACVLMASLMTGCTGKFEEYNTNPFGPTPQDMLGTRVRDNILKSKEQKNIQPTKGGHKMVTCQNYVSLFYRQITSCPSDGGIS